MNWQEVCEHSDLQNLPFKIELNERGQIIISSAKADDFATEVELLRKNHDFLAFLDECKRDTASISFDEAERLLR